MRLDKGLIGAIKRIKGVVIREHVPLFPYTTFKIGGPARLWIAPQGIEPLGEVLHLLNSHGIKFHMLGGGSNVLISDNGLECVVSTCHFEWVKHVSDTVLEVGAGVSMKRLIPYAIQNGLAGLEHLCGIPGSIGGAIVMNAGGKQGSIRDALESVYVMCERGGEWIPAEKIEFGYRSASFPLANKGHGKGVVAKARFKLTRSQPHKLRHKIRALMKRRQKSQPIGARSAGCIFKNPQGAYAGALIEASGLKGMGIGGARISQRHANFIVNIKRARAQDVMELIKRTRDTVFKDHGVILEPEVKIVGMKI